VRDAVNQTVPAAAAANPSCRTSGGIRISASGQAKQRPRRAPGVKFWRRSGVSDG